jgi:transposase
MFPYAIRYRSLLNICLYNCSHGRMITPFKKPAGGELLDWQKEFNSQVNKIRWIIEQTIANFKTWRAMHTDYRRPIETFTEAITAVASLEFYRIA